MHHSAGQQHLTRGSPDHTCCSPYSFTQTLMAAPSLSPPSPRSLPSCLLIILFCLFSFTLVSSRPLDSTILNDLFGLSEEVRPIVQANGREGSAEASSLRDQRDVSTEADPVNAMERGVEPGQVWPRLLLDIMGHQNRFRGRTKKNMVQNCMGNELEATGGGKSC